MSSSPGAAWYELSTKPGGEFVCEYRVRFSDCDPAGIVFYPNYLVMLNGVVEDWFSSLGAPWDTYHMVRRMGCPTAQLDSTFLMPTRQRIVSTSLDTQRTTPWPDDIRTAIHRFTENS
ncbi:MAG: acyl-CoA thioesterase [Rhodoferax sp.]